MLATIAIVILVVAFLGVTPMWFHSRDWGYVPTKGVGTVLLVAIIVALIGRI